MSDSKQVAATCPLCGGDNQCAIAAGKSGEDCWCQTATISAEARAKAAGSAGEQCICRACGRPTGASQHAR
ncbi:MAG: cysteine-rich CWC family protein [Halioglobus sp.]|nr:cysteine-rich CWC family protein [Halioglobus sp.]